ncbi:DUF222 domain-containing protein [Corynebacterium sp. H128]|uniref:HNH endonuclease signature motif containing protein n=1 Tax=Corynebacterium sp. H128 TaxID=3133427 RepID=UPI0030A85D3D
MNELKVAHYRLRVAAENIDMSRPFDVESAMSEVSALKEFLARFETNLAANMTPKSLHECNVNPREARTLIRRASSFWDDDVPVAHQDEILRALSNLSPDSKRREEIYDAAAQEVRNYNRPTHPDQTWKFTRDQVLAENQRLAKDPLQARAQRRFTLHAPDEDGGAKFSGYVTPEIGALLQSMLDQSFGATPKDGDETRTIRQRQHDAFARVVRWASSNRVEATGHASLVVSVTEDDEFDLYRRFPTNTAFELNLLELANLGHSRITDFIAVHTHTGAVKKLVSARRTAGFYLRIALLAEQLVCQYPGCDVPAGRCEAHHIIPWSQCHKTALENLGLMCRNHHRRNHDDWDGPHMEKRAGHARWIDRLGMAENTSPAAKKAAGKRIRTKPPG